MAFITETMELDEAYSKLTALKVLFIFLGLGLLVVLTLVSTTLGSAALSIKEVVSTISARIFPFLDIEANTKYDAIVWDIRLPRIVMAILAGAGLAISGAAMQGIMRNPLVSPFTIGISSAASFGASVAIILGAGIVSTTKYLIITNAFIFALLASLLVFALAKIRGMRPETVILAGIALNYFFSAGTSILQYIATEEEVHSVVHWLFGTLTGVTWENILLITILIAISLPLLIRYSWDVNALVAGDDLATTLGVHTGRVRTIIMVLSSLMTAGIISFTGIIGFVGLVAPHITRMIVGSDHRFLLPCSSILGGFLLLGADTIGRTAFQPTIIPVGIVVSVIGVPFFVFLILKTRKEYFQ
jgi:iron complex transport system permease protein